MNKNHARGTWIAIAACGMLGGCTTMVAFTSQPPGAAVKYQSATIGTTPFTYSVSDQFGWFSVYTFTAEHEGYDNHTLVFRERTPFDAQRVVPTSVAFELKAKPAPVPAPAAAAASAPAAAAPAPAVATPPPASPPPPPVAQAPVQLTAEQAVRAWAAAWSRRDMDTYFAAYTASFKGNLASRQAWQQDRRKRIEPRQWIEVEPDKLVVQVKGDKATARFHQKYKSDNAMSTEWRRLDLVRDAAGGWLIRSESGR
jgi:ketosteroid isomerase-like protein